MSNPAEVGCEQTFEIGNNGLGSYNGWYKPNKSIINRPWYKEISNALVRYRKTPRIKTGYHIDYIDIDK